MISIGFNYSLGRGGGSNRLNSWIYLNKDSWILKPKPSYYNTVVKHRDNCFVLIFSGL